MTPDDQQPVHPAGSRARVLLVSVFGPYARDDEHGSRLLNPAEPYHGQVTRGQGAFSVRVFWRHFGMMLIQVNLKAPCTLLDYPTEERFVEELTARPYDVVGITAIPTNLFKVRHMCRLIRKHRPQAEIVVGGHIANVPRLTKWVDADHVVKGDGVAWMRRYLGEDDRQPVRHPVVRAHLGARIMGVPLPHHPGLDCATLIPSVGCPMGCNFCSTSAMFGGKGKRLDFYRTGAELFEVACALEEELRVQAFLVLDENFLLGKQRVLELLELMERHHKPWSFYIFSSANAIRRYSMEQLVALGVSWVWLGIEGQASQYVKLAGTDSRAMVRELQDHGIRIIGSTIIGLEEHTPENIDDVIDYAVGHGTELHQFMLYGAVPGTPLFGELTRRGALLSLVSDITIPDSHGQYRLNFRHPHIPKGAETEYMVRAFQRDFEVNGPSVVRIVRTTLRAWQRYKHHPNPRVRARFAQEAANLPVRYAAVLWAAQRHYPRGSRHWQVIDELLGELQRECGWTARVAAPTAGRFVYHSSRREEQRLAEGWTYEPPTFFETNSPTGPPGATRVVSVTAGAAARPPAVTTPPLEAVRGAAPRSTPVDPTQGR